MIYEMAMTSMPPQVLHLHLPHSPSSEAVVLRIFFPKPQRYDTYVDGVFVPPANLNTSAASYKLLPENPTHPQAFLPMLDNAMGTSYFQRSAKLVHVVLCEGHILDIKTTPMITLTSGLVVKEDEFYEQNLVLNLASLFEVSPDNIRVISVMREHSKRQQGRLEVGTVRMCIGSGWIMQQLCLSLLVSDPIEPPPKEAPPKATEEEGTVVIPDVKPFYKQQEKEVAEKIKESLAVTTRMAKEILLKYPEILHAGHPFFLSLKFVGAGGSLLDGAVFVDQKILIEILGRDVSAWPR
ncbi:hypothetical protein O3P69_011010 [Scylla paramamosain]|uniref:Uncharacterized protein n=1 Tax=Scylla paramamosain TaxID=85552 RepID=A0AAW0SF74_SCYPA